MSREKGRVVKPEIPGSGGSVCCTTEPVLAMLVDLRAEVKRLKAAHAAKDAALVRTGKWVRLPDGNLMCQVCCTGMRCGCPSGGHIRREDCPNCLGKSGAALSPSAEGKGLAMALESIRRREGKNREVEESELKAQGWVGPEEVKRLLEYCNHHSSCILAHHAPGIRDCGCGYLGVLRAALEAGS